MFIVYSSFQGFRHPLLSAPVPGSRARRFPVDRLFFGFCGMKAALHNNIVTRATIFQQRRRFSRLKALLRFYLCGLREYFVTFVVSFLYIHTRKPTPGR